MRELISIVEARAKTPQRAPRVDPAVQTQTVYDKALTVAKSIAHRLMIRHWDQTWVTALNKLITDAKQRHEASEADELKYDPQYQAQPFALDIEDATNNWWQQVVKPDAEAVEWSAQTEFERYQDDHPKVEQSDRMSLHQAEIRMAKTIVYEANDSLNGLTAILRAIDDFAHSIDHQLDIDYTHVVTRETQEFIERIIPAILTICRMYGAKKSQ